MSLDSFLGNEGGEGMSESAFEAFKEKMKAAAAQIAQIKKEESKQKKKEEELLKILLYFVKHSHKRDLVLLISRVLEKNLPANFILSIVLLGNEEIQQAVGKYLMLNAGPTSEQTHSTTALPAGESHQISASDNLGDEHPENALIFFDRHDESLPLKLKIEIDNWIKNILFQADESPQKLLKTAYHIEVIEHESEFGEPHYEEKKRSIKF